MYASDLFEYKQKGNGVILIWRNRFVFAIGKDQYWDKTTDPWTITYTNTGGHVESQETVIEATRREVKEELGCNVEILPSEQTLYCSLEDRKFTKQKLNDTIPPLLIYNSAIIKMSVSVFFARILVEPKPHLEVPALLLLPPSLIGGGQLSELLNNGALLKEQVESSIPRSANLHPFGSAELLAVYYEKFNAIANFNQYFV
ncbi:MAG: NUDIX domain-containing protein [Candidatus Hodarchaeota archaeon]